jgi:uncharacterized iron-regulated membrane protein
MRLNSLIRKVHHWTTLFIAIPVFIIICSGVLLQVKKQASWIQPAELRGTGTEPQVNFEQILNSLMQLEATSVSGWDDVDRLDVRPGKGVVKVLLKSGWEVQVDLGTGQLLQTAYRRSDLIESIHDGSFFGGDWVKLGLFLPAGIALFLMWLTGLWMFVLPYVPRKWRMQAARRRRLAATR